MARGSFWTIQIRHQTLKARPLDNELFFSEVLPDRPGNLEEDAIVIIMQRLHKRDVSGVALDREMGYTHVSIPMEYEPRLYVNAFTVNYQGNDVIKTFFDDQAAAIPEENIFWRDWRTEDGELAWPERFPLHVVEAIKRDKGPIAYAGNYQQRPTPRGGNIIKRNWWQLWREPQFPSLEYIIASLDTAFTDKTSNDQSALTVWGLFRQTETRLNRLGGQYESVSSPRIVLLYAWARHLEFHDLIEQVLDTCTIGTKKTVGPRFNVDTLLIENSAAGKPAASELSRVLGVSAPFAIELIDGNRTSKVSRVYSIEHMFSNGMIYAPDKEYADLVINQVCLFPVGRRDDLVDSTSMAIRWLRDNSYAVTQVEEQIEERERGRFRPRLAALYPA